MTVGQPISPQERLKQLEKEVKIRREALEKIEAVLNDKNLSETERIREALNWVRHGRQIPEF